MSSDAASPRSVVVFLHGFGDQAETTPAHHRPWLDHLARQGSIVLYPRYELHPGGPQAMKHLVLGTLGALRSVDPKGQLPLILIGYSRGGGMAVDLAALSPALGLDPRAVLSVFPATMDPFLDYRTIPAGTRIVILVGDMDTVVGDAGARKILDHLRSAGVPESQISPELVRSPLGFEATHLAPLSTSEGARHAFWDRADRLIDAVRPPA